VAAHLETDILLVDEVLAVGDIQFQNKCLGKMQDVAGLGRTVLFVSHNLAAIQRLCSKAILLEDQTLKFFGAVETAISKYLGDRSGLAEVAPLRGTLSERIAIRSVSINDQEFSYAVEVRPRSAILLKLELSTNDTIRQAKVVVSVTKDGRKIINLHDSPQPKDMSPGVHEVRVSLPSFFLSPGQYGVGVLCFSDETKLSAWSDGLGWFIILPEPDEDYDIWNMGIVNLKGRGERLEVAN
jgi:lipopolysaccharide transport system ATP-binding protein